ncbi:glycosyltransferase family 61 protein [Nocardioides pacificus]
MPWTRPSFPVPVQGPSGVETVDDALLTHIEHGELNVLRRPDRWLRGAVHDRDGALVRASQMIGGLGGNRHVAADPAVVEVPDGLKTLTGTWLYGGHWMGHFGHFITETLPTLWPQEPAVEGLVFHRRSTRVRGVTDWQQRLLTMAGLGDLPLEMVRPRPLRVEHLLVAARPVVMAGWARPEAVEVWRRVAAGAGAPPRDPSARVYLSRTEFNRTQRDGTRPPPRGGHRSTPERDEELDAAFAAAGFSVVSPERLSIDEQIRTVAGAAVIAGPTGSALHLSAFAPPGLRVLAVGDDRSPDGTTPMQDVIDTACGHLHGQVPAEATRQQLDALLDELDLDPTDRTHP